MGVTVSINHESFPEGVEFGIDNLGIVPNGGSLEVPDENAQRFASVSGMTVEDAFANNDLVNVSGSADVEVPEGIEPPGPEQGVTNEEQEQTTKEERTEEGQETPQSTEDTQVMPPQEGVS